MSGIGVRHGFVKKMLIDSRQESNKQKQMTGDTIPACDSNRRTALRNEHEHAPVRPEIVAHIRTARALAALRQACTHEPETERCIHVRDTTASVLEALRSLNTTRETVLQLDAVGALTAALSCIANAVVGAFSAETADVVLNALYTAATRVAADEYFTDQNAPEVVTDRGVSWHVVIVMQLFLGHPNVTARGMSVLALLAFNRHSAVAFFTCGRPVLLGVCSAVAAVDLFASLPTTVSYMHWLSSVCFRAFVDGPALGGVCQMERLLSMHAFAVLSATRSWLQIVDIPSWKVSISQTLASVVRAVLKAKCQTAHRRLADRHHQLVVTVGTALWETYPLIIGPRHDCRADALYVCVDLVLLLARLAKIDCHYAAICGSEQLQATLIACMPHAHDDVCNIILRLYGTGHLRPDMARAALDAAMTCVRALSACCTLLSKLAVVIQTVSMEHVARLSVLTFALGLCKRHTDTKPTRVVLLALNDVLATMVDESCLADGLTLLTTVKVLLAVASHTDQADVISTCFYMVTTAYSLIGDAVSHPAFFKTWALKRVKSVASMLDLYGNWLHAVSIPLVCQVLQLVLRSCHDNGYALPAEGREYVFTALTTSKAIARRDSEIDKALSEVLGDLRPSAAYGHSA